MSTAVLGVLFCFVSRPTDVKCFCMPHRCQALLCTKTAEAREVVTLSSSPFEATPLPAPMLSFSFPTSVEATPPTTDARLFFWGVEATPPNDFFLYLRLGSCDGVASLVHFYFVVSQPSFLDSSTPHVQPKATQRATDFVLLPTKSSPTPTVRHRSGAPPRYRSL